MQALQTYDLQTQELIVKFGIRFLDCMQTANISQPIGLRQTSLAHPPQGLTSRQEREDLDPRSDIEELKSKTETLMASLNTLQIQQLESNRTLQSKLDRVLCTSAGIGQQGEYMVERALVQQYPQAIVMNTSKIANSGDLLVTLQGKQILIEVKNYSTTVDQKEVTKFMNDVNTSQCDCGIFISFDQRIANRPRISFELTVSGKQVVFLSQQEGTDSLLVIVDLMCQFLQQTHLNSDKLKKQQQIAKQSIEASIASIKKQHTQTATQLKQLKITWDYLISIQESMNIN